jgi:hypothetical protein
MSKEIFYVDYDEGVFRREGHSRSMSKADLNAHTRLFQYALSEFNDEFSGMGLRRKSSIKKVHEVFITDPAYIEAVLLLIEKANQFEQRTGQKVEAFFHDTIYTKAKPHMKRVQDAVDTVTAEIVRLTGIEEARVEIDASGHAVQAILIVSPSFIEEATAVMDEIIEVIKKEIPIVRDFAVSGGKDEQ